MPDAVLARFEFAGRSPAGILIAALLATVLFATPAAKANQSFVPKRPGEVIFLRGLANIFSLGLDTLSEELRKYGVYSYVHNHRDWEKK